MTDRRAAELMVQAIGYGLLAIGDELKAGDRLQFRGYRRGSSTRCWQKIDVNAFAMETYWQDVAYHFASDELHFVCALA